MPRFIPGNLKTKKENLLIVLYVLIIIAGIVRTSLNEYQVSATFSMPVNKKVVVIDAGHGGWDPGKVGGNDKLEKDINLQIAEMLQMYLEQGGSQVIITRADDEALADSKNGDLQQRQLIANTTDADIFISIHQNSYPDESVHGAQVFYYGDSKNSKTLAESIQKQIQDYLDSGNKRGAKANNDYYVLKKTTIPAVIVECGFLSNHSESQMLSSEDYQRKVAWAIYMGVVNYFASSGDS